MPTFGELIERPQWRAAAACEIARMDPVLLRQWRKLEGLGKLGKFTSAGEHKYSALDICQMSLFPMLRELGYSVADTIAQARDLRGDFRSGLINRLGYGFWSHGGLEVDSDEGFTRTIYADQILERVIDGCELGYPKAPKPPKTDAIRAQMKAAIEAYFSSRSGIIRFFKWRKTVLERGGAIPFDQAAWELGAPEWFLRDVLEAQPHNQLIVSIAPGTASETPSFSEFKTRQFEGLSVS